MEKTLSKNDLKKGINVLKCKKCGYQWVSRVKKPKACPYCKQYFKV